MITKRITSKIAGENAKGYAVSDGTTAHVIEDFGPDIPEGIPRFGYTIHSAGGGAECEFIDGNCSARFGWHGEQEHQTFENEAEIWAFLEAKFPRVAEADPEIERLLAEEELIAVKTRLEFAERDRDEARERLSAAKNAHEAEVQSLRERSTNAERRWVGVRDELEGRMVAIQLLNQEVLDLLSATYTLLDGDDPFPAVVLEAVLDKASGKLATAINYADDEDGE